ncbi:hypothetical protein [Cesiribacter andamanensis]|uniref:Zinc-ribbon 15 domain-containing protein n=1 Tax=Cesiribacter andamanensis AMV16 TaxID=1279009 RepID=M7N936_9BACT|nr:hypothetical protein [Cesiribacter andamanensis]EMR03721.1 hypothetical protein ADICEAN_01155 [Cesiribacter andamanensis AMV16]
MFFYGIEATPLGLYQAERVCCSRCGAKDTISMKVFAKYFHVSRIPSFPLGKIGVAVCRDCHYAVNDEGFQHHQQYKAAFQQLRAKTSVPYWSYAGSAISGSILIIALMTAL